MEGGSWGAHENSAISRLFYIIVSTTPRTHYVVVSLEILRSVLL